ncbi:MAG: hypothetical protein KCHDKBKB_02960 [Elusimicrobia bacterium]|nr:hypothetical protein [Elusimicrobiota bacterium]
MARPESCREPAGERPVELKARKTRSYPELGGREVPIGAR